MAVKIRLKRIGKKRTPHYRIVVSDVRNPRDGRFIEEIGIYSPKTEPQRLRVDLERAQWWIDNGAKPTDTVRGLIKRYSEMSEEEREASSGITHKKPTPVIEPRREAKDKDKKAQAPKAEKAKPEAKAEEVAAEEPAEAEATEEAAETEASEA